MEHSAHKLASGGSIVWSRAQKQRETLAELRAEVKASVAQRVWQHKRFVWEFYEHRVCVGQTKTKVFWALPQLQHALLGEEGSSKWACRNVDAWGEAIRRRCTIQYLLHVRKSVLLYVVTHDRLRLHFS